MTGIKKLLKKKLNSRSGFSLTELLAAVIILLLVSSIVASGIPVARDAYEKVVLASNAEVLLSSTISTLRNELGTGKNIQVSAGEIVYLNLSRESLSRIYRSDDANKEIMFDRYYGSGEITNTGAAGTLLMSSELATQDLYVTYTSVDDSNISNGYISFTGLSVKRRSGAAVLAKRDKLSIRLIAN